MPLFEHTPHPHVPRNVNEIHKAEQGFNARLAVTLTKAVGTMYCAYAFTLLAIIGFPSPGSPPSAYVQWISQTLIQLVMLSVIMVGQSIIGHKQELQADEAYNIELKNEHEIAQIAAHLAVQDEELTKQTAMLAEISRGSNGNPGS